MYHGYFAKGVIMFIEECNSSNIEKVINYCRQTKLCNLEITKIQDELCIKYDIIDNIDEKERFAVQESLNNSTNKIVALINHLKQLSSDIENQVSFKNFSLSFKYSKGKFLLNYEKIVNPVTLAEVKKVIDFEELFKDQIAENRNVPGIYKKVSSKKYAFVSYKELAEILKQEQEK
jgi:hypothetical protein